MAEGGLISHVRDGIGRFGLRQSRWAAFIVSMILFALLPSQAAAQEETRNEFWPELDLFYRLDAIHRIFVLAAPAISKQDNYAEGMLGLHYESGIFPILRENRLPTHDIDRFRYLRLRVGIRYLSSLPSSESSSTEWRGIVELTPRAFLPFELLASLRNRVDLRWISGDFSARYRIRLTVERETRIIGSYSIVPYISAEVFYDTRFKTWARVRYQFGVTAPIVRLLAFEAYFARQNDWHSQPAHVHAFGLVAIFYL